MRSGKCKLCREQKLLVKSHIVPEFMYNGLLDNLNRVAIVPLNEPHKGKYVQKGLKEYLLCSKCDNDIIGKLELYTSTVLYNKSNKSTVQALKLRSKDGIRSIKLTGIDYSKFKLFFLSLLLRAHYSQDKFFSKFRADRHEEKLREMILNNDPGPEDEYKLSIVAIKDAKDQLIRIMPNPEIRDNEQTAFATFFINGFIYFIDLGKENGASISKTHFLNSKGEIEILLIDYIFGRQFLSALGLPLKVVNMFYQ